MWCHVVETVEVGFAWVVRSVELGWSKVGVVGFRGFYGEWGGERGV